jgi:hypothetical protein
VEWRTRLDGGRWIADALTTFATDVTSLVPSGFEAYARLFHPCEGGRRWAEVAAETGRVAHNAMQAGWIRAAVGSEGDPWGDREGDPESGTLPRAEGVALGRILAEHTSTPDDLWFAVWDGWDRLVEDFLRRITEDGGSDPSDLRRHRMLRVPNREYHLLHGSLDELPAFYRNDDFQSPNLWWPADHAWCVATEIDLNWTVLGGRQTAIDAVLASPELEVLPIEPETDLFRTDPVNASSG